MMGIRDVVVYDVSIGLATSVVALGEPWVLRPAQFLFSLLY